MVSTKDLALKLAASCKSERKKHGGRRKLEICHQSSWPMQHNYNLYAYYALFRRGSKIWRWHSDGESEEVAEASDADRDGGIAEAICSTMCTNLCHHVLPRMISSLFADIVLCTASLSCF